MDGGGVVRGTLLGPEGSDVCSTGGTRRVSTWWGVWFLGVPGLRARSEALSWGGVVVGLVVG